MSATNAFARNSDLETSHDAAESIKATNLESIVLNALRLHKYGATSFELAAYLEMSLVTVSPRLRPLAAKGLAKDSGRRVRGSSGRYQTVWVAV
jgi:hypothetical protein